MRRDGARSRRRVVALAALSLASGCVEAQLAACADGRLCPRGLVCADVRGTCVDPSAVAACASIEEGAQCGASMACHDGVCWQVVCGDGVVDHVGDAGEVCDDANRRDGDGCNSSCTSLEVCSNGIIDIGEQCEGDLGSHDGCDSQCQREAWVWTPIATVATPHRIDPAYAYDSDRDRLVVVGGSDVAHAVPGTFEFDSDTRTWALRSVSVSPPVRIGAVAAFDAARHEVVLFGGGNTDETWIWDGNRWTPRVVALTPPRRSYAALAYDPGAKVTVMFGGGALADTWIWDGVSWRQANTVGPTARSGAGFVWDPVQARLVLFGGQGATALSDMWTFDTATEAWRQVTLPSSPIVAVASPSLIYDPTRRRLVVLGNGATMFWNGTSWTTGAPIAARSGVAYFDPVRQVPIYGLGWVASSTSAELYEGRGDAWVTISPTTAFPALRGAALAYDSRRRRVVLVGGETDVVSPVQSAATYEHGGSSYRVCPSSRIAPQPQAGIAAVYDPDLGATVAWGGHADDPALYFRRDELWSSYLPAPGPEVRQNHGFIYDPDDHAVLMFGGDNGTGSGFAPHALPVVPTRFGDFWKLANATWTALSTENGPLARTDFGWAWDAHCHQALMFAGSDAETRTLGDTWTWSSMTGWREQFPTNAPSERVRPRLIYDPMQQRVLLLGGATGRKGSQLADAWTWQPSGDCTSGNWQRELGAEAPIDFHLPTAIYDEARRQILVQDGTGTWRLQVRGRAPDEACVTDVDRDGDGLAGCADPDCAAYCP